MKLKSGTNILEPQNKTLKQKRADLERKAKLRAEFSRDYCHCPKCKHARKLRRKL